MKRLIYVLTGVSLITSSCKKDQTPALSPLASINVTNAVVGGGTLTVNTSAITVTNNNFAQFSLNVGQSQIDLYPSASPNFPYYNQTIPTSNGDYYSLFLAGTSPSSVDAVLIKENYKNYSDSICGVRFINLSPDSQPISVNLSGQSNGSEIPSLAYKANTSFKQYPAKAVNTSYTFQFRDAATGNLLLSYALATPFFPQCHYCT